MWTYQLRYVKCGKPGCRCAGGQGHGPYWYGFRHRGGKMSSKYFGKLPPWAAHDDKKAPEPRVSERWKFDGRMTWAVALRIMGFGSAPGAEALKVRYRTLMQEHHPDHGGATEIAAAIIAAYAYLK